MRRLLVRPRWLLALSRQEGNRQQRASFLGFHELEGFGVLDTALCSPTPVHPFVGLPDFFWSLALVLVKRSFFHISNWCDVEEEFGSEADRLLIGHHLEEVEAPAAPTLVTPPDQGADNVVVRVRVERPVRHHDVGLHLGEPGRDLVQSRLVSDKLLVGVREELRLRAEHLAGGGRLLFADLGLGPPEEATIIPEARAIGADDFVVLAGQRGDQPARSGFGIVGVATEDDHTEFPAGIVSGMRRDSQTHRHDQSGEELHASCLWNRSMLFPLCVGSVGAEAQAAPHQIGDDLGIDPRLRIQSPDHLPAPPLRVVLGELPLALQSGDLDAEPDDRLEHPLDMRLRLVEGPRLGPGGFIGQDRPSQDVQQSVPAFDEVERAVGVNGDVVPGRHSAAFLVPGRGDVGVRPGEDDQHLTLDALPLRVRPCHVTKKMALRPGVGIEQEGQMAGDQPKVAMRGQDGEAVPPHELVQLGRVGLGEGGWDVHARCSGNAVGPRAQVAHSP